MPKSRILIVDNEISSVAVGLSFLQAGFAVSTASPQDGYQAALCCNPDLAILDLRLVADDGFDLCRKLRSNRETQNVAILTLSDGKDEESELLGFECGVDDYIAKPFEIGQLIHRARILLKRRQAAADQSIDVIRWNGVELYLPQRIARINGDDLRLTATEFLLLWTLFLRPGRAIERRELLNLSRGIDCNADDRTIDAHILSLRRKLAKDASLIETVRGVGYRSRPDTAAASHCAPSDELSDWDSAKRVPGGREFTAVAPA